MPYSGIRVGPVVKRDVMRAAAMLEHDPMYAVILAFDVKVEKDAQELADKVTTFICYIVLLKLEISCFLLIIVSWVLITSIPFCIVLQTLTLSIHSVSKSRRVGKMEYARDFLNRAMEFNITKCLY